MLYFAPKKTLWLFILRLAAWSLLLGLIWLTWLQSAYPHILKPIAFPFFRLVGVDKWLLTRLGDQFISLVGYAALVLASTTSLRQWKRTLIALLSGFALIAMQHLFLSWAVFSIEEAYADRYTRELLVQPLWVFNTAAPLVLWVLFYAGGFPGLFRDPASMEPDRASAAP